MRAIVVDEIVDRAERIFTASCGDILKGIRALERSCEEFGIETAGKSVAQLEKELTNAREACRNQ